MISEDDFEELFRPIYHGADHNAVLDEPPGDVMAPLEHVWTVVDGDDGDMYAIPGYHIVNKVGYVITENPWHDETEEAVWCHFEDEEEES